MKFICKNISKKITKNIRLVAVVSSSQSPTLPTDAVSALQYDWSAETLGYTMSIATIDTLINQLYSDGFVTDCLIDLTGHGIPSAASATALTALRTNNTVLVTGI